MEVREGILAIGSFLLEQIFERLAHVLNESVDVQHVRTANVSIGGNTKVVIIFLK